MSAPRLVSSFFKTVSTVGLLMAAASIYCDHAIAQPTQLGYGSLVASAAKGSFRRPKNPRPRSGSITATGHRGGSCLSTAQTAFTTLGPDETIGLTASTRPEFVWYLPASDIAYPITFRLLVFDAENELTLVHTQELAYTSGFVKYALPAEVADLSPGNEYHWQVVVQCNPARLSQSRMQELAFKVVSPDASLLQSLNTATTDADKALAYGQSGFWYDAIAQVAQSVSPQAKAVRRSLLEDLANTATGDEEAREDILHIAEVSD